MVSVFVGFAQNSMVKLFVTEESVEGTFTFLLVPLKVSAVPLPCECPA
jgi:hypothetical protein